MEKRKNQDTRIEISKYEYLHKYAELGRKANQLKAELLDLLKEKRETIENEREISSPAVSSLLYLISLKDSEIRNINDQLKDFSKTYRVVSDVEEDETAIQMGDYVCANNKNGDVFEFIITSFGKIEDKDNKYDSNIILATANAPLSKSVLGHKIGDICSYEVNSNKMAVQIIDIIKAKDLEKKLTKVKEK